MPSSGATGDRPVIRKRRSAIMCRASVVGMSRPSSRDRFPRWKRRWCACSHSVHSVTLATAGTSVVDNRNEGMVV